MRGGFRQPLALLFASLTVMSWQSPACWADDIVANTQSATRGENPSQYIFAENVRAAEARTPGKVGAKEAFGNGADPGTKQVAAYAHILRQCIIAEINRLGIGNNPPISERPVDAGAHWEPRHDLLQPQVVRDIRTGLMRIAILDEIDVWSDELDRKLSLASEGLSDVAAEQQKAVDKFEEVTNEFEAREAERLEREFRFKQSRSCLDRALEIQKGAVKSLQNCKSAVEGARRKLALAVALKAEGDNKAAPAPGKTISSAVIKAQSARRQEALNAAGQLAEALEEMSRARAAVTAIEKDVASARRLQDACRWDFDLAVAKKNAALDKKNAASASLLEARNQFLRKQTDVKSSQDEQETEKAALRIAHGAIDTVRPLPIADNSTAYRAQIIRILAAEADRLSISLPAVAALLTEMSRRIENATPVPFDIERLIDPARTDSLPEMIRTLVLASEGHRETILRDFQSSVRRQRGLGGLSVKTDPFRYFLACFDEAPLTDVGHRSAWSNEQRYGDGLTVSQITAVQNILTLYERNYKQARIRQLSLLGSNDVVSKSSQEKIEKLRGADLSDDLFMVIPANTLNSYLVPFYEACKASY